MRSNATLLCLAAATSLFAYAAVFAQESQETPAQPAPATATSTPTTPTRGSTMDNVRQKFGAPTQEIPAVGQPPITRWEYPGYVVYFENDKVLHTVVVR